MVRSRHQSPGYLGNIDRFSRNYTRPSSAVAGPNRAPEHAMPRHRVTGRRGSSDLVHLLERSSRAPALHRECQQPRSVIVDRQDGWPLRIDAVIMAAAVSSSVPSAAPTGGQDGSKTDASAGQPATASHHVVSSGDARSADEQVSGSAARTAGRPGPDCASCSAAPRSPAAAGP